MAGCAFPNCDADAPRRRQSERNGNIYRYCADHDPLESDRSFAFTEVEP